MPIPREEPDISPAAPPGVKPRLSIVVVLAMLLGVVLTVLMVSAYFNYQRINALQDEVRVTRSALKDKSHAVEEMQTQIGALSKQMSLLKEYSIARSVANRTTKADGAAPVVISETPAARSGKDRKEVPTVPTPEKTKKPKSDPLNCDLVGKSADEQAATLDRCAAAKDSAGEKPQPR